MTVLNYVPLSAVLAEPYSLIDGDSENYADLESWAALGWEKLQVRQNYEEGINIVPVIEHSAVLPRGIRMIEQILYRSTFSEGDLNTINLVNQDPSGTITPKILTYGNSLNCLHESGWSPLRAATSIFSRSVHCLNSINLSCSSTETYSVNKSGCLTVSLREGYLAIAGLFYPMTADGEFLVADDPDVIEALKDYVLSRIWERKMNYGVENAPQMHKWYLSQFETRAAKARGKLLLPSLDGLQNLQDQMLRIGPNTQNYFSGFGNLAVPETVFFNARY